MPKGAEEALESYLRRAYPFARRNTLDEILKKREVRRDGVRLAGGDRVRGGDELRIYVDSARLCPMPRILAEWKGLVAVDKPAGLPTTGEGSMEQWMRLHDGNARACHRLDAGTCGALLFARDEATFEAVVAAFREGDVQKTYRCLTRGIPAQRVGALVNWLVKDSSTATVRAFDKPVPAAKRAELRYRVLGIREGDALLEIDLLTGRTHQIRVQLAHIGHPVLGDDRYGDRACNRLRRARRLYLQATRAAITGGPFAGFVAQSPPLDALVPSPTDMTEPDRPTRKEETP